MNAFTTLPDEKEVLSRLNKGDENAFTQIYHCYWKPLFYLAANKLHSMTEAEEIVQEIFLDLWRRKDTIVLTGCLSSYLAVCVKYRIINALAKRSLHQQYQQQNQTETFSYSPAEEMLDFDILKEKLEKETRRLPEKCQLVFRLSREEGYSHKEIGAKLCISEKTVEAHVTKALRLLRAGLIHMRSVCLLLVP
jgi:RNA polymerase sigma-70 factor (ECF subfamily)